MTETWQIDTDVLVIGGGQAACWAAIHAWAAGAEVILVDKGYCGTSGATAPAGTGVWHVAPDPAARAQAKAGREALGGYLADHYWMDRVLDQTYANMNRLATEGRYPFPVDPGTGRQIRTGVQGPEYMRRMRAWVRRAGVRILDHSPALELLVDADGAARPGIDGRPTGTTASPPEPWCSPAGAARSCRGHWAPTSIPATGP